MAFLLKENKKIVLQKTHCFRNLSAERYFLQREKCSCAAVMSLSEPTTPEVTNQTLITLTAPYKGTAHVEGPQRYLFQHNHITLAGCDLIVNDILT